MTAILDPNSVAIRLEAALPGSVQSVDARALVIPPNQLRSAVTLLRDDPELDLTFLANLTAVDWESHFEVVYHLQSLDQNQLLTVKCVPVDHETPSLPSLVPLYRGALLQERELYDLMGIQFEDHPDLRRLFLWEGFPGHPLRKDFLGMPGGLKAGLPGFPHESGANAWPVPGSTPSPGGAPRVVREQEP